MVTAILETPMWPVSQVAVCGSLQIRRMYKVTRFLQRHPVTLVAFEKENWGLSFNLNDDFQGAHHLKRELQVGSFGLFFSKKHMKMWFGRAWVATNYTFSGKGCSSEGDPSLCVFLDGWVGQAQELAAFWAGFFCVERLKININKPTYLSWGSTTSILMLNGVDPWINPIMLLDQSEDPKNPTILGICRDMTTAYISSYIYVSLT